MRILIFTNAITLGGAERQVVQDANLLVSNGYKVFVCYGNDGPLKEQFLPGVKLFCLHTNTLIIASFRLYTIIKNEEIDIVLSHMFWANKVSSIVGCFVKSNVVFFEHGLGLWRKWYHLILVRLSTKIAKVVVTCSEASKEIRIVREKLPSSKVINIPNSFNPLIKEYISRPFENEFGNGVFKIGFAGRFNAVKQLNHLLAVAEILIKKKYNAFLFVLIGDGEEMGRISQSIKEKHLEEYFYLTGYVSEPQKYLNECNCFILPSRIEDFSVALLEASSVSLPCIAYDVGGNGEIIKDGTTGYIVPLNNIGKLADRVIMLINDRSGCTVMGNNAELFVNKEFSQEQRLSRLQKLISDLHKNL